MTCQIHTKYFTKTIDIDGVDVLLHFDAQQEDFSWEYKDKGASGFSSLQEAETDAIFWTRHYGDFIHHEHLIRADDH